MRNRSFLPTLGTHWKTTLEGLRRLDWADRLEARGGPPWFIRFHSDFPVVPVTNLFEDTSGKSAESIYVVQTQSDVIQRCLLMTTDSGDLALDPTCGSGTTAYVAEQRGRRWITCDTSRVALARTRLMAAKYPYYLLADSPDGIKKESELTGKMPPDYKTESDIKKGFVYKRVPYVTLKSIANNPDIHEGMTRAEIDVAIARHTESELSCPVETGRSSPTLRQASRLGKPHIRPGPPGQLQRVIGWPSPLPRRVGRQGETR